MRILLLLDLNLHGADPCDGADLAAALQRLGHEALAVVRARRGDALEPGALRPPSLRPWSGLRAFRRLQREFAPACVVLAGAAASRPFLALVAAMAGPPVRRWAPPYAWGVDLGRARKGRLALWDGDYLLCPTPADEAGGAALLEALARVGEEHPQLDLVVLGEPQRGLLRAAERLAVAARVHFAGRATREAEWAWIEHARAVVLLPHSAVSPGVLMRCWALGRPPVAACGLSCAAWVEKGRTGWRCVAEAAPLAEAIRQALDEGPRARAMAQSAREAARQCSWDHAARALDDLLRRMDAAAGARRAAVPRPRPAVEPRAQSGVENPVDKRAA